MDESLVVRVDMMSNDYMDSAASDYTGHKYSWETPPEPVSEDLIVETVETDVLIIGGGIAGLASAARCAQAGLRVVLLEKTGGIVAHGAHIGVTDSSVMRKHGVTIEKKQFARDWMRICGSRVNEDLLWLYINRSYEAIEWLIGLGGSDTEMRLCGGNYRGPDFTEYAGTHYLVATENSKYKSRGSALMCQLCEDAATANGAKVFRRTAAKYLEKNDGRVSGAIAECEDGKLRRYSAAKAVVIATGDIAGNPEMMEKFCPTGLLLKKNGSFPKDSNNGDGHLMGLWAGGAFEPAPWALSLHLVAYAMYAFFFLHVNRQGKRYMNEDTWVQAKALRTLMQKDGEFAFSVFDSKYYEELTRLAQYSGGQFTDPLICEYGDPWDCDYNTVRESIEAYVKRGLCFKADTIEDLARQMGVPVETFAGTVARYNENFYMGDDRDYGKRSILLTSIDKPPYYALKFGPALLTVFGGLLIDTDMRVLDDNHDPVPGLFAVGNCSGGFHGVDYPLLLNGNSSGRALTWAMVLAETLSRDGS